LTEDFNILLFIARLQVLL